MTFIKLLQQNKCNLILIDFIYNILELFYFPIPISHFNNKQIYASNERNIF